MFFSECYVKCDTFIFPKSRVKPTVIKKTPNFTSWISGDSTVTLNIPEPSWMMQMCLEIHLIPFKELFLEHSTFDKNYDISTASNELVQLFQTCYYQHILNGKKQQKWRLHSVKEVW